MAENTQDLFAEGLSHPTSMAFVDNATLLVLKKDIGSVRKITDGLLEKEPVLQVNVDNTAERGLLGMVYHYGRSRGIEFFA